MPSFEQHCEESVRLFGEPFAQVHRWLDELAGTPEYGMRHRRKRHHQAGIEEVRGKWGNAAAEAARQHVISDLKQEGWTECDRMPKNESDYVRIGFF